MILRSGEPTPIRIVRTIRRKPKLASMSEDPRRSTNRILSKVDKIGLLHRRRSPGSVSFPDFRQCHTKKSLSYGQMTPWCIKKNRGRIFSPRRWSFVLNVLQAALAETDSSILGGTMLTARNDSTSPKAFSYSTRSSRSVPLYRRRVCFAHAIHPFIAR